MGSRKTVGVILRETAWLYRKNFITFFVTTLIAFGASYLFRYLDSSVTKLLGLDNDNLKTLLINENIERAAAGWGLGSDIALPILFVGLFMATSAALTLNRLFLIPSETFTVGAYDVMFQICKGKKRCLREAVLNFRRNWKRYLGISAWSSLFILLWSFLFLIPGLVKTYAYQLAPLLILDYPEMTVRQALKKSIEITNGYKGRLFGLAFLVSLPFGIISLIAGFLFMVSRDLSTYTVIMAIASPVISLVMIQPMTYMMVTIAYLDLKRAAIERGLLPSPG